MIGDPKQAIYTFAAATSSPARKPADVPAERRFTWRPTTALLTPISTSLMTSMRVTRRAFDHKDIIFTPSSNRPAIANIRPRRTNHPNPLTACIFDNKDLAAKDIVAKIVATVADPELTITLDGVPRRPRYSDMAVLVRTSKDGDAIEKLLVDREVPVIWTHAGNIFLTAEADELLDLMTAVTQCKDSRAITKVLASRLFSASADDLLACATTCLTPDVFRTTL